jgi:drug/metabolite transporter (DMT)-like permease
MLGSSRLGNSLPGDLQVTATSSVAAVLPPTRRERVPLAILYMVSAGFVFAFSSAMSKWLVATYPVGEVLFTRALVSLIALGAFILPASGLAVFHTRRPGAHLVRGVSQATSQTLLMLAFSLMPLASATAINFSAPLFATLASIIFLREGVGAARWTALAVGFIGVLLVTRPDADTFQAGALYALANAVLFGTVTAGVRGMTRTESTATLTLYQMAVMSIAYGAMLSFGVVVPGWGDALMMLANGLFNAVGQYWWTRSLHLAPTAAVAPFQYLSLVWALIIGFAVWGDVPTAGLLIGSAIVVGSGVFLFWHESRRAAAVAAEVEVA